MHSENLSKFGEFLTLQGVEAALIANPFNVTWLTGYAPGIQTGPSPFEGGPALAWIHQGELTLVVNDWEAGPAEATGSNVQAYTGYTIDEPLEGTRRMVAAFGDLLKAHKNMKGKVGVEMNHLPTAFYLMLQESLPQVMLVNLGTQVDPLRSVKSNAEIEKIRAAVHLSDVAQEEIRKHIREGITELELMEHVRTRVELEAGCMVPVLADLVAGMRTAEIGGPPSDYALQPGDPVMLDFVSRLDGYWGDNCAGYFVGEPSSELEKIYKVVQGSLQFGAQAIRPGLRASELDSGVRDYIRQAGYEPYPHHTGHGLGTTYHDEPRIVPYNHQRLEPGMVMVLEPGIYVPGVGGVRLEDAYMVTTDGCEVLTKHLI